MKTPIKSREPMFNFSDPVPVWTCGVLILFHILRLIMPEPMQERFFEYFLLYFQAGTLESNPSALVLHALVHADWGHILMNCGFIAIFGIIVCRSAGSNWRGAGRFLAIFTLSVVAGALVQSVWMFASVGSGALLGASGGGAGLFAAAAYALGGRKKLLQWGMIWLALNVALLLAGKANIIPNNIAVIVHVGGYVGGALLALVFLRPNSTDFRVTR